MQYREPSVVDNLHAWFHEDVVVCVGYVKGVVLPNDGEILPEQERILDYICKNHERVVLLRHASELDGYFDLSHRPQSAEVVGAYSESCVYNSALRLLDSGVATRVNPDFTIGRTRLLNTASVTEESDRKEKTVWLKKNISGKGFVIAGDDGYLVFSPLD